MKCTVIIDKERDEEVLVYAKERNEQIKSIESFVTELESELYGYRGEEIIKLNLSDVACFTVEDGKTYAYRGGERFLIKSRLYILEETVGNDFIKINQSCIINLRHIERFDASISGTLLVKLKCGYKDYVSRRQLKAVKERMRLK